MQIALLSISRSFAPAFIPPSATAAWGLPEIWVAWLAQVYGVLGRASYFGEGCVISSPMHQENARCRTTVAVLILQREDMDDLLAAYPHIVGPTRLAALIAMSCHSTHHRVGGGSQIESFFPRAVGACLSHLCVLQHLRCWG